MDELIAQCAQMMGQMSGMTGSGMIGGMMTGNGPMLASWASPWYWLVWVLVVALTVFLITAFVWAIRFARRPATHPDTPLAILQLRLAKGDIAPEQFDAIRRQLA